MDSDLTKELENERHPFEELVEEFLTDVRRGCDPQIEAYALAHSSFAESIREVFPALLMLEQAARVDVTEPIDKTRPLDATLSLASLGERDPQHVSVITGKSGAPLHFDDFQIVRRIGHGGMGIVYEAIQCSLQRPVALKVINEVASSSEQHRQRFRREAESAAGLHHTNIVPIYGIGEDHGLQYYAMQLIDGVTMAQVIQSVRLRCMNVSTGVQDDTGSQTVAISAQAATLAERLVSGKSSDRGVEQHRNSDQKSPSDVNPIVRNPEGKDSADRSSGIHGSELGNRTDSEDLTGVLPRHYFRNICRLMSKVANAIEYAHEAGVLHRDIKPSNLLLDQSGTIWVADFGLARRDDWESQTQSGEILGTLRYMAPEQLRGTSDVRSDIYSLGLTLFELLTLRPAFSAPKQRLLDPANSSSVSLSAIDKRSLPIDLQTILQKACATEPAMRYQRAREFEEDLLRFLEDRPILARRASWLEKSVRWARRNPAIAALAGTLFGLLLTLAILLGLWNQQQRESLKTLTQAYGQVARGLEEKSQALRSAEVEQRRAERNLELALEAFDTITDNIASRGAGLAPTLLDSDDDATESFAGVVLSVADVELLKSLQMFFERFAEENTADLRFDAAIARRRVGEIEQRIGKSEEAIASLGKAIRELERLRMQWEKNENSSHKEADKADSVANVGDASRNPVSERNIQDLLIEELKTREVLVEVLSQRGMMPRAVMELDNVKRILVRYPDFAKSEAGLYRLASLLNKMSSASARLAFERLANERRRRMPWINGPRANGAKAELVAAPQRIRIERDLVGNSEAVKYLETLCHEHADSEHSLEYKLALARTYRDRMGLCRILGQTDEASDAFDKSKQILVGLMSEKKDSAVLKYELANLYFWNVSNVKDGEDSDGENSLEQALRLTQEILEDYPLVPEYQTLNANLLVRSALQQSEGEDGGSLAERIDFAVTKFQQAIGIHQSLVDRFPDIPIYAVHLLQTTSQLGEYYGSVRRPERARQVMTQAAELAEKIAKSSPNNPFVKSFLDRIRERRNSIENRQESNKNP